MGAIWKRGPQAWCWGRADLHIPPPLLLLLQNTPAPTAGCPDVAAMAGMHLMVSEGKRHMLRSVVRINPTLGPGGRTEQSLRCTRVQP